MKLNHLNGLRVHLKLSLKNKQCFMCNHFKGKGTPLDIPEKCSLLKVSYPFYWKEYYSKSKYPDKCLSICEGIHFKPGGEYMKIYNRVKQDI
jgi:hypothetical protein